MTITGGYSTPITVALTPYTVSKYVPSDRRDWPPALDSDRLAAYEDYLALVENRPWDVFASLQIKPEQKSKVALALALPELLCNVWADALWGEQQAVGVELPTGAAQTRWDEIAEAADLPSIGWESVFGAAMRGTAVVRVNRSDENVERTGNEIGLEEISPAIFFPKLRRGSARWIEEVWLAYEERRDDDKTWDIKEWHRLDNGQYAVDVFERTGDGEFRAVPARRERPVGVDFLPFVDLHAKRWGGRFWGVSELARNMGLFDDIDNGLSNIAEILEYHGKPVLQVPASVLFGGTLFKGADRAIGIRNPAEAGVARYITFDGQIDAQMRSLEKSIELAFLVAEVPRAYFGEAEGLADSGTAIRLRLQNYLKKAGRWQRNEDRRLRQIVDYTLRLSGISNNAQRIPTITFGSPLPADAEQEARIEQGLVEARLSSRRTAITRLRRVDDVEEELAEIDADAEMTGMSGGFGAPMEEPPLPGEPEPEIPVEGGA